MSFCTMASDPALLQLQLRRNAEEMQEYMKGLENWEEEIKQRDTMLKKQKPILKKVCYILLINMHTVDHVILHRVIERTSSS